MPIQLYSRRIVGLDAVDDDGLLGKLTREPALTATDGVAGADLTDPTLLRDLEGLVEPTTSGAPDYRR